MNVKDDRQHGLQTKVVETVETLCLWRTELSAETRVGFVPTMGALHAGHMSLVKQAAKDCDQVIVSIFVNPLQFGAGEDLDKYPRTFEKDLDLCQQAGVHAIFHPNAAEMYGTTNEATTIINPPEYLTEQLCGLFRPGHFAGVATVVAKLFSLVQPHVAYFGEKDYQQLAVIRKMVKDLNIPITVYGAPIVRENDGLAMSSRNVYMNPEQRKIAPVIYQTLCFVRDEYISKKNSLDDAIKLGKQKLEAVPGMTLQYLEAREVPFLQAVGEHSNDIVILVAVQLGNVRLIDNIVVVQ